MRTRKGDMIDVCHDAHMPSSSFCIVIMRKHDRGQECKLFKIAVPFCWYGGNGMQCINNMAACSISKI